MQGGVSRAFTVGYWVALPILALFALGAVSIALQPQAWLVVGPVRIWLALGLGLTVPALVVWRILVHRRARRRHRESQLPAEFD